MQKMGDNKKVGRLLPKILNQKMFMIKHGSLKKWQHVHVKTWKL